MIDPENAAYIDDQYAAWKADAHSVEPSWRHFFEGMAFGEEKGVAIGAPTGLRISKLIRAYRTYGHLIAKFNPIDTRPTDTAYELDLKTSEFEEAELDNLFPTAGLLDKEQAPLREIIEVLRQTYCGKIGIEYMGLQHRDMEKWLQAQIEPTRFKPQLDLDEKRRILADLNKAELFEIFLHTKYVGQKRFSLEGGETLIPVLHTIVEHGGALDMDEFVIGMAHRGRLSVLANILNKSYANIFHEFQDTPHPDSWEGSGDVKYHKGFSSNVQTSSGKQVHLSLTANPSHLEAVDPVVQGQVRAKQVQRGDDIECKRNAPIFIHGDASLAGQGVVYETMQMCGLHGYGVGGTIHIVVNNQIGFTTLPKDSRSTRYCTDIARAFSAPVFHVNGDDPQGCAYAAKLAVEIRQKFGCDVFIDINCYRKYGHNEADEPAFTQPLEYELIRKKQSPRVVYRDDLITQGIVERQVAEQLEAEFRHGLQKDLDDVQSLETTLEQHTVSDQWRAIREANRDEDPFVAVATAVPADKLVELAQKFCCPPQDFKLHRKIEKLAKDRLAMCEGAPEVPLINWGMAEHLAFATLLDEERHVRVSGQDSRRGTFNHRHAMWMDQEKEGKYFALNHLRDGQGRFDVFNSHLAEYAVMGFEFGYSLSYPEALVIWEAQFGDFANTAQVMVDQFVATSEQKWGRFSGLVLLLPHGYEGQGPEHSSARVERYLQLCGDNNMRVTNPTTPAQFFHLLRRQVLRPSRKPLIVFTPKQLFGHPDCMSSLNDLSEGSFKEVLQDPEGENKAKTVVLCSGRVYYDLIAERAKRGTDDTAIIRIEQLYPFPEDQLLHALHKYPHIKQAIWVQEEPSNMGAWDYVRHLVRDLLPHGMEIGFVGRRRSASPATGSPRKHKAQTTEVMNAVFGAENES